MRTEELDELATLREEVERLRGALPRKIDVDPDDPAAGLARLVLTVVELVRQLLERQAIRRMEGGSLTDEETERVGVALMKLEEKVVELAESFGLRKEDLALNVEARSR